jgi:DNA-binding PadR family transcriptional regulator
VAGNRRLLAMLLYLASGPKAAKDIVRLKVYEKRRVKVRKKVRERVETPWGWDWDYVEREVEEEREGYYPLPQSTAYRVLKRLRELGLVEAYRGVDFRKRYYKLTDLGVKVAEKLKEMILEKLREKAEKSHRTGKLIVSRSKVEESAEAIGVEPRVLIEALGLKRSKEDYGEPYVLPKKTA